MFNNYNRTFKNEATHIHMPEHIHEHRAPTDESIRILSEMETKARQKIIHQIRVDDNTLNGVAIAFADSSRTGRDTIWIQLKFSINGVLYEFEEETKESWEDYKEMAKLAPYLESTLHAKVLVCIWNHFKVKVLESISNKNYRKQEEQLAIGFKK